MSQYMEVVSTESLINDISSAVETQALSTKQDKLTAGSGITISDQNVISATGGGGGDAQVYFNLLDLTDKSSNYLDEYQGKTIYVDDVKYIYGVEEVTATVENVFDYDTAISSWVSRNATDFSSYTDNGIQYEYYKKYKIGYGKSSWYCNLVNEGNTMIYGSVVYGTTLEDAYLVAPTALTTVDCVKDYVDRQITTAMSASY